MIEPIFDDSLPLDEKFSKFCKNALSLMKLVMKRNIKEPYLCLLTKQDIEFLKKSEEEDIRKKLEDEII